MSPASEERFGRAEWAVWKALRQRSLARRPTFADYAIAHPEPSAEMDPRLMRISAQLRYTAGDEWLVFKERNIRDFGNEQFIRICERLATREEFRGSDFSWRRLGCVGSRATRERCWTVRPRCASTSTPKPARSRMRTRVALAESVIPGATHRSHDTQLLAGILVLDRDCDDALYVEPGLIERGIGSELVALATRRRPRGLQLWSFESNAPAHRFYERHGFVAAERTDGSGNEERSPDERYVRLGRAG